jgi:cyclopropane fatty-acyl-phospholipid synthase-like methyltransferase
MGIAKQLLNPATWIRAYKFHKKNSKFDKSQYDLELYLYSKILKNDMLHYGYFDNPEVEADTISIRQLEDAQVRYAENIIDQIVNREDAVLDVGCGMGGLAKMMLDREIDVEVLTPNANQIEHIAQKYPSIPRNKCKFEKYEGGKQFGTVINSESLQYIKLEDAFEKLDSILKPGGRWIIVDYFRKDESGISKSGHTEKDFKEAIAKNNWKIVYEQDITPNVLPTLRFAMQFVDRIFMPVAHFTGEKLRYKKAWLYSLLEDQREKINKKIEKERASIDPEKFAREKKYAMYVLEKMG